jgi:hypothetical protein
MIIANPVTVSKVPGNANVGALFSSTMLVRYALIMPKKENTGTNDVLFDFLATPLNTAPMELAPVGNPERIYDLAQIKIKADNATDGVLVTYVPYSNS